MYISKENIRDIIINIKFNDNPIFVKILFLCHLVYEDILCTELSIILYNIKIIDIISEIIDIIKKGIKIFSKFCINLIETVGSPMKNRPKIISVKTRDI